MRISRTIKQRAGARSHTMKGGNLSNIQKLEEDFVKQMSFGKASNDPNPMATTSKSSDAIKKKFSI